MSRVNLAKWLSVDLSISDQFSFQALPEFGIEEGVVCFWEDDQVSFLVGVDEQPVYAAHAAHWAELQESLGKEFGELEVLESDIYAAEDEIPVSYKLYGAGKGDDKSTLIYHLISGKKASYWVIASLIFCTDAEAVNSLVITLLETAKIK